MLQVGRELRASKQDYTFDHVVAPMEVQRTHQARIEYLVQWKDFGLERARRSVVTKFYKLNAVVALESEGTFRSPSSLTISDVQAGANRFGTGYF